MRSVRWRLRRASRIGGGRDRHALRGILIAVAAVFALGCGEVEEKREASAPAMDAEWARQLDGLGYIEFAVETDDTASGKFGVLSRSPTRSWRGYDLITYPVLARAELIDADGQVRRSWAGGVGNWQRASLESDGSLLVVASEPIAMPMLWALRSRHFLRRFSFDGELSWEREFPVHHSVQTLRDGRLAVLTLRFRAIPEEGSRELLDNGIAILSADGETTLEEYSIYDMLMVRPDLFRLQALQKHEVPHDFLHANRLDWMSGGALAERDPLYASSNVLITLRMQDTVAIFDTARGELVWAWGQGEIVGPHDAQVLANGHLLIFDNRSRSLAKHGDGWSRIIELDPLTREIVWEYRADPPNAFYSHSRGTVQRLPNGNTVIASSNQARGFEVTPDGDVVWTYLAPPTENGKRPVFRMQRYAPEFVEQLLGR